MIRIYWSWNGLRPHLLSSERNHLNNSLKRLRALGFVRCTNRTDMLGDSQYNYNGNKDDLNVILSDIINVWNDIKDIQENLYNRMNKLPVRERRRLGASPGWSKMSGMNVSPACIDVANNSINEYSIVSF